MPHKPNSWAPGLDVQIADYLASTQSRGKTWRKRGHIQAASAKYGVSTNSIVRWLDSPHGAAMFREACAKLDKLLIDGIKGDDELSLVEKLALIQNINADRLMKDSAGKVTPRDRAAIIRDTTHVKQLLEEKPTEIVEYLAGLTPAERAAEMARAERDLAHAREEARVGVVKDEDSGAS